MTLSASPIAVALSMDRLAVVSRVASRLAAAAARAPTISCAAFHKTWSSTSSRTRRRRRARCSSRRARPGRAPAPRRGARGARIPRRATPRLGDVVGDGGADVPPRRRRRRFGTPRVHGGADFLRTRFFATDEKNDASRSSTLAVWRPVPPPGFVALGVVCAQTDAGAPLDALRCVRRELVAAAVGRARARRVGEGAPALWVVENAARTLSFSPTIREGLLPGPDPDAFLDIRVPTGLPGDPASANPPVTSPRDSETGEERRRDASPDDVDAAGSGVDAKTVVDFHRVWHSFNAGAAAGDFSVWRARRPPGWVSLGDVAVAGLEPPARTVLFRESKRRDERDATVVSPALAPPAAFERVWRDSGWRARGKPRGTLSFWRPVPSEGYVACGHVASDTHAPPPIDVVACLRADLACAVPPSAMGSASFARGGRRKFAGNRSAAAPVPRRSGPRRGPRSSSAASRCASGARARRCGSSRRTTMRVTRTACSRSARSTPSRATRLDPARPRPSRARARARPFAPARAGLRGTERFSRRASSVSRRRCS